jgi:hypothetical protein
MVGKKYQTFRISQTENLYEKEVDENIIVRHKRDAILIQLKDCIIL